MGKILDKNKSGVSQLIQSQNTWAIDLWRKGCANHWMPQEVDMSTDIKQWKNNGFITEDEKLLVKRTLGLFAMGESMVSNSIDTVEYRYITDGACRQYLLRKKFVSDRLQKFSTDFDIETKEGKQAFLKNMATFYLVMEGTWFFSNFALIMSLGRQNKLTGLYDQINYTIRDESIHVEFGVNVINKIKEDYPSLWTKQLQEEISNIVKEGVEIEINYAKEILPNGILGVTADMLVTYIKYLANTRVAAVGLPELYEGAQNPFPWLGEAQDATGMTAFFERREKNYQNAGVLDDDLE